MSAVEPTRSAEGAPLATTVYLDRLSRWRWVVTASTIPAGGSGVDRWTRWGRERAAKKAQRVHRERNRRPRYADDSRTLSAPSTAEEAAS